MGADGRLVRVRQDRPEVRGIDDTRVSRDGVPRKLLNVGTKKTRNYGNQVLATRLTDDEKARFTSMAGLLSIPLGELIRRAMWSYCDALADAFRLKWNVESGEYEEAGDYDEHDVVRPVGMVMGDMHEAGMRPRLIPHGNGIKGEWVWEPAPTDE